LGNDGPQLRLVSTEDQIYEWKTQIGPVEFIRLVYHVTKDNKEYVYNEIVLNNQGLEKTSFSFFVAVRPMTPLGFEPIETSEYDTGRQKLFVNGTLALKLGMKPVACLMCESTDQDLKNKVLSMSTQQDIRFKSDQGLATTVFRFEVTLSPAGSERIFLCSPLFSVGLHDDLQSIRPVDSDRDKSVGQWFEFASEGVKASFPDTRIDTAFNQAKASLAMQIFPTLFPECSYLASLPWKERIRILVSLIRTGNYGVAERVIENLLFKSDVLANPLDTSVLSPMLWGILQFFEYNCETSLDEKAIEQIRNYTHELMKIIKGEIGLEKDIHDDEFSSNDDQPLQHYLVVKEDVLSDFEFHLWNLAALKAALHFFTENNDAKIVSELTDMITKYQLMTTEKSKEIQHARWLRSSDASMPKVERAILDVLASVPLLQISYLEDDFLNFLSDKITNRRIIGNLWKFSQPSERYSSHLALRLAHYYVKTKQRDLAEPLLDRVLDFFSDDYHLPDFVDTRTYGGSAGMGSSAIAAADFVLLLLDMILCEEKSALSILPGVPLDWFTAKRQLIVDCLPTRLGEAHIEIGSSSNQHQIEIGLDTLPDEVEAHVPSSVPISMMKAYGATIVERISKTESPHLKLIPLSNEIVLTFHK
jgi:hypothetical protein